MEPGFAVALDRLGCSASWLQPRWRTIWWAQMAQVSTCGSRRIHTLRHPAWCTHRDRQHTQQVALSLHAYRTMHMRCRQFVTTDCRPSRLDYVFKHDRSFLQISALSGGHSWTGGCRQQSAPHASSCQRHFSVPDQHMKAHASLPLQQLISQSSGNLCRCRRHPDR